MTYWVRRTRSIGFPEALAAILDSSRAIWYWKDGSKTAGWGRIDIRDIKKYYRQVTKAEFTARLL